MHLKFVSLLACPQTGKELKLEIKKIRENKFVISGFLFTSDRKNRYPIINGIPRFINFCNFSYLKNFDYEWSKWSRVQFEMENKNRSMAGHTIKMFKAITGFTPREAKDKLIVEFGCGPGRFLDIVQKWGGVAVGIDIAGSAVEAAYKTFENNENVLIVQGDILSPPFKKDIFDFGYTIGTLHHLPHPPRGLFSLIKVVKPGGKIACSVYSTKSFYNFPSLRRFRQAHKFCVFLLGWRISKILVIFYSFLSAYFLYYLFRLVRKIPFVGRKIVFLIERNVVPILFLPTGRWRVLDMFDAITPVYASTHTPNEVKQWFKDGGCQIVNQTYWDDTSFVGIKD